MSSLLFGFALGIVFASAVWNVAFWYWYGREETTDCTLAPAPAVCICEQAARMPGSTEFANVSWCGFHSILIANRNGELSESTDGIAWTSRGRSAV